MPMIGSEGPEKAIRDDSGLCCLESPFGRSRKSAKTFLTSSRPRYVSQVEALLLARGKISLSCGPYLLYDGNQGGI